ncbi:hypothetical protein LTR56_014648 [Elasticomyces elasticus]|nr:hypothetical protein LTR56_014648 [Elasticomyces elasticus]KAK3645325.1 hypothetical protein LTR22_014790 [Elasticomyces elasticus]KAK4919834.1 hypothetical protein LTR49_012581 [Elasticomyces elasticus]KAK5750096.1 hypothetical protein LTS12_019822 [Elasticomyces elasticus]
MQSASSDGQTSEVPDNVEEAMNKDSENNTNNQGWKATLAERWQSLPVPDGTPEDVAALNGMLEELYQAYKHPNDTCGMCGSAKTADGSMLLVCGRCKALKYCSVDCQRDHWGAHKAYCKKPKQGKKNMRGFEDVLEAAETWLDKKGYGKEQSAAARMHSSPDNLQKAAVYQLRRRRNQRKASPSGDRHKKLKLSTAHEDADTSTRPDPKGVLIFNGIPTTQLPEVRAMTGQENVAPHTQYEGLGKKATYGDDDDIDALNDTQLDRIEVAFMKITWDSYRPMRGPSELQPCTI